MTMNATAHLGRLSFLLTVTADQSNLALSDTAFSGVLYHGLCGDQGSRENLTAPTLTVNGGERGLLSNVL